MNEQTPTVMKDGYRNLASGMARGKSKAEQGHYVLDLKPDTELVSMYRTSWVAKRIVDIPANDATRRWRSWSADKDTTSKIEAEESRLGVAQAVRDTSKLGRLTGVGLLYMSVDDDLPRSEPLDLTKLRPGALKRLSVMSKSRFTPGDIDEDPDSEFYGQPATYKMKKGTEIIHASRFVFLRGERILDVEDLNGGRTTERGWDAESVLQSCYNAVRDTDAAIAAIAEMLQEAKVDILKVPDLMNRLKADPTFADDIVERMQLANMMKGINNALLMDSLEDLTTKQLSFGGVSEVLEKMYQIPSGASEIPVTRFWGRSPAGLSATGESDLRLYYDTVASAQNNEYTPALGRLDKVMLTCLLGQGYDDNIIPSWRPLWAPNENERVALGEKLVTIGKGLVDANLVSEEIVGKAVTNALIEFEVMPGLEAAIDEAGGELTEEEDLEANEVAANISTPPNQPPVVQQQAANDAAPRTLYVSRKVLNGKAILDHYGGQGVEGEFLKAEDLHVTICYSRAQVDWMKMPEAWSSEMTLPAGGARLHETLGKAEPYAGVLLINAAELRWRHESLRDAGASHDFAEYQPHVTIGYGLDNLDLADPFIGEIKFGPEIWEEVNEDWKKDKLKEEEND